MPPLSQLPLCGVRGRLGGGKKQGAWFGVREKKNTLAPTWERVRVRG